MNLKSKKAAAMITALCMASTVPGSISVFAADSTKYAKSPHVYNKNIISGQQKIYSSISVSAEENDVAYQWYLEPSIDADEVYVYDVSCNYSVHGYDENDRDIVSNPYNYFAIVKNGNYYNMIDYNGKSYLEDEKYTDFNIEIENRIDFIPSNATFNGDITSIKSDFDNKTDNIIIKYDAGSFDHGMPPFFGYTIKDNSMYYFVGDNTDDLLPIDDNSYGYSNDYKYYVVKDLNTNLFGLSDKECNLILSYNYKYAYYEQDSSIIYFSNDGENWEVFDIQGNKLFDCRSVDSNGGIVEYSYFRVYPYTYEINFPFMDTENKVAVYNDNGCAYFGTDGTQITNYGEFEEIRPVHNNLAWVKKDGKWGIIQFGEDNTYIMPEITKIGDKTPSETAAWKDAYKEILKSCDVANATYGLYDLDNDGIPELFVPEGGIHYSGCNIYSYADGEVVSLGKNGIYGWIRILTDTGDIIYGNMQQGGSVAYSLRKSGNKLDTLVSYVDDYFSVTDNPTFTVNDKEVSAKEYVDSYNSNFKGREELTLGMACNCPSVSDYSLIDNYTNNKDSLSMQGELSINEGLSYEDYGIKVNDTETTVSETTEGTTGSGIDPATLLGDVTCDGDIDVRDVTRLNQYIVKMADLSEEALANSDVIADGTVDLKDLGQLKKFLIKVIDKF